MTFPEKRSAELARRWNEAMSALVLSTATVIQMAEEISSELTAHDGPIAGFSRALEDSAQVLDRGAACLRALGEQGAPKVAEGRAICPLCRRSIQLPAMVSHLELVHPQFEFVRWEDGTIAVADVDSLTPDLLNSWRKTE